METNQPQYASMSEVVMKKDELLAKLTENKAKHDVVLATAVAGYWEMAQAKLEEKKKKLHGQVTEFIEDADKQFDKLFAKVQAMEQLPSHVAIRAIGIDAGLDLVYPQDHSKDYERAIRMMEASIHNEVKLSVDEFDAYVLNNWEWKANFISAATAYVDSYRNKYRKMAGPQGALGSNGPQGASFSGVYAKAAEDYAIGFAVSGANLNNF